MRQHRTVVALGVAGGLLLAASIATSGQDAPPAPTPLQACAAERATLREQLWQAQTEAAIWRSVATGDVTSLRLALTAIAQARAAQEAK